MMGIIGASKKHSASFSTDRIQPSAALWTSHRLSGITIQISLRHLNRHWIVLLTGITGKERLVKLFGVQESNRPAA